MNTEITPEIVQDYIDNEGQICPFCGYEAVAHDIAYQDSGVITVFCTCTSELCDHTWSEVYRMVALHTDEFGTVYGTEEKPSD